MAPAHSQQNLFVPRPECLEGNSEAPVTCGIFDPRVRLINFDTWVNVTLFTPSQDDLERRRRLRSDYCCHSGANNSGLLKGDRFNCFSEIFLMIERQGSYADSFSSSDCG